MEMIREYLSWFWVKVLGVPTGKVGAWFNLDTESGWRGTFWRLVFLIALLLIAYEVCILIRHAYRKYVKKEEKLTPDARGAEEMDPGQFREALNAQTDLKGTVAPLKKAKQYDRVAEIYASLNKHGDAAKWFKKAGLPKRAAAELAKAGKTVAAARLLMRSGEYGDAAHFFTEKGKHRQAAQAFEKAGSLGQAAAAYMAAKRYANAAATYKEFFGQSNDNPAAQGEAAARCHDLLEDARAQKKIAAEDRSFLLQKIAERYAAAGKDDLAAQLFREGGRLEEAGNLYVRAGKLELAAQCMKEAGNHKAAAEIGGKFYESKGRWNEAAMAYEGAGEFRRAGDCYSRANDAMKAAECFGKAGEHYGAAFALVHAKQWAKAIPQFQKVQEDNKNYPQSRLLLGRCFYEMGDHEHCVATLENHLTGAKVEKGNIDYFWMLALAYEQIGQLEKSKQTLQKIRTVDVDFRDVSTRLSNIESRISMAPASDGAYRPGTPPPSGAVSQEAAVMSMVESSLRNRYKLEAELGRGGMGVVYKAFDTQLDRPVALKFLGALVDGSDEYKQRFIREAKAAAKVQHPNIISIYDIGAEDGKAFIAMEYVEGPNLHKYLKRKGRLEPREAINVMGQACSALDAVHQAGIIHRDIKPDNILIAKGGLVKLMDFGLAKAEGMRLTGTNVVMGTPCYMAPEQAMGKESDARSDIYAMGLVLHELLTGKTVFLDGDVLQRQVSEMPAPPSATIEGIPSMLDQIVMKCIAKKPEERFQSIKEMMGYLRQVGK